MPEYRLYCLNDQGRFTKSHEIEATDDRDALFQANAMNLTVRCELWQRARKVAEILAA